MAKDDVDYPKLKLLVVEDEMHTRTLIKTLLRQIGLRAIDEAANGRDALVKVVDWRPHMILCDIHMKPVNGLEFLQMLRKLEDTILQKIPVILLTSDAKRDNVLIAKELAVSGYLVKPVSLATLKERIDTVAAPLKL